MNGRCPSCGAYEGGDHHSLCGAVRRKSDLDAARSRADRAEAELARVRRAIENAPCPRLTPCPRYTGRGECNCWKRAALAREEG